MKFKKITAVLVGIACLFCLASCEKDADSSVSIGENGVGELITPDEKAEDAGLGSYRLDKNGIKLYYDDTTISPELMLALENYFLSFQNGDAEAYKNAVYPDYAERYNAYLEENMNYSIDSSFEAQCSNIRGFMLDELYASSDSENTENFTGDFKITRIRGERPPLDEGQTEESRIKDFFSYLDNVFDMDYYNFVAEQADGFEYLTFFIIAEGEDGEEHLIIRETDIVFAEKDGKYYTFG